jgi:hypothetical protein
MARSSNDIASDTLPSKHMYLGYGLSSISRPGAQGESASLAFDKRAEISESDLADLFGLPNSNSSTGHPPQNAAQMTTGSTDINNKIHTISSCIQGFDDFSI